MEPTLAGLRAAAEPTRLRILALCAEGELTVSELVRILGQSQPRVSRHLKVLTAAGLLTRVPEGSWVFHRLAQSGGQADLAAKLVALAPQDDDTIAADMARLETVKLERAEEAACYFRDNAGQWDKLRSLHVDDAVVEQTILDLAPSDIGRHLDLGTGTGRVLELLADRSAEAYGADQSREMLAIARARLEQAGLGHCHVRQADITQLPFPAGRFDLVTIHQVLHFMADPIPAIQAATKMLAPGGMLLIVDFAPHEEESLRRDHQHRRLGFSDTEAHTWFERAGLTPAAAESLSGEPLTVRIWTAVNNAAPSEISGARRPAPTRTLEHPL
ncbi:MAG: metalloregulator ArsR/SmtB family transcription factor [Rhodospirillaceae bacterium]